MACTTTLTGITFGCTEIPTGGITKVLLGDFATVKAKVSAVASTGIVTITPAGAGLVTDGAVDLFEFNIKDGFSVMTDVKTVNSDGTFTVVPTLSLEFPVMNADKRLELEKISGPFNRLVAFVETAAGTYHMLGYDFGLYFASVDGSTGTGRAEKNRWQMTLTGEENSLGYNLTSGNWTSVIR
jgi:hypothetical protein